MTHTKRCVDCSVGSTANWVTETGLAGYKAISSNCPWSWGGTYIFWNLKKKLFFIGVTLAHLRLDFTKMSFAIYSNHRFTVSFRTSLQKNIVAIVYFQSSLNRNKQETQFLFQISRGHLCSRGHIGSDKQDLSSDFIYFAALTGLRRTPGTAKTSTRTSLEAS